MKHATAWVVVALLVGAESCFAQDAPVVAPTAVNDADELLHTYLWSTFGHANAIRATFTSSLEQSWDAPREWGTGGTGYAKRWASEFAQAAVGDMTAYVVARTFHHDPTVTRCECSGFANRLRHALSSPFMARTRDGTRVVSPATVAGLLVGRVVSASTWYPAPRGARDGLNRAASDLVAAIGGDVLREFLPPRARW